MQLYHFQLLKGTLGDLRKNILQTNMGRKVNARQPGGGVLNKVLFLFSKFI